MFDKVWKAGVAMEGRGLPWKGGGEGCGKYTNHRENDPFRLTLLIFMASHACGLDLTTCKEHMGRRLQNNSPFTSVSRGGRYREGEGRVSQSSFVYALFGSRRAEKGGSLVPLGLRWDFAQSSIGGHTLIRIEDTPHYMLKNPSNSMPLA